MDDHRKWGTGYSTQQSTRPQTLGYGLVDSPAGQAAWIVEKFWAWTDYDGHPEDAVVAGRAARQRDALLAARHGRVVGPPLLGELQQLPRRRHDRPSRRACRSSRRRSSARRGAGPSAASPTSAHWNELDARRPLRRLRAARRRSSTRSGPSSAPSADPISDERSVTARRSSLAQSSTTPSVSSRRTSAWPAWRAVSSIMWTMIQRRLTRWSPSCTASSSSWAARISSAWAISAR